jgi:hypothetical protein
MFHSPDYRPAWAGKTGDSRDYRPPNAWEPALRRRPDVRIHTSNGRRQREPGALTLPAVGYRTRVIASHGPPGRHAVPPLIYKAEGFDETDRFGEQAWTCSHEHGSVEEAVECGNDWIARQRTNLSETA